MSYGSYQRDPHKCFCQRVSCPRLPSTELYAVVLMHTAVASTLQHCFFSVHVLMRACTGTPIKQKAELSVKLSNHTRVLERQLKAWFLEKWS